MDRTRRPMTPLERRYLRWAMNELRKYERCVILRVVGAGLLLDAGLVWMLTYKTHMTWHWVLPLATLFLLGVGFASFRKELAGLRRWRQSQARAWRDGTVQELRVRASAMIALEGSKDTCIGYAFQSGEREILFLRDQPNPTARFPNDDFALVRLTDDPEDDDLIVKHGARLAPSRTVPATFLAKLRDQPQHLERAAGTLDDLEAILTAWPRDRLA